MAVGPIVFAATHPSGGIGELWENLAAALAADGRRVRLLAFYPPPGRDAASDASDWLILESRVGGAMRWPRIAGALARYLARERPAMIVTAMPAANVLTPAVARIASPGTRVVVTHHSPTQTHSRLLDTLDTVTGRLSNVGAVVGVSDAVSRSLAGRGASYRAKVATIRNALPPDVERLLDSLAPPLPRPAPAARRLVATGRLAYQKNYPVLLRALARLPEATLDIVGDGPDAGELAALADTLGIAGRVTFHGFRPREAALRLLATGDVFCQVSRFEGHSLGLIEAARLGLPLVVSDVPEQVEAVTAADGRLAGAVVGVDDDSALARTVGDLFASADLYRAASAASRAIAEQARFDAVIRAYAALAG